MVRAIFGCVLVLWSLIIIPANTSGQPYATIGDLIFGFFILLTGTFLVISAIFATAQNSRAKSWGDGGSSQSPDLSNFSGQRIAEQVVVSLIASAIIAALKLFFG